MPLSHLKSTPADSEILAESAFPAPIERVWQAWTDPERIVKWFGLAPHALKSAEVDLRNGGAWRFIFSGVDEPYAALEGVYIDVEAPSRLVFSWRHVGRDEGGAETATPFSEVAVSMQSTEGGALVQVRHTNIQTLESRTNVSNDWDTCLGNLAGMLEAETLAPG